MKGGGEAGGCRGVEGGMEGGRGVGALVVEMSSKCIIESAYAQSLTDKQTNNNRNNKKGKHAPPKNTHVHAFECAHANSHTQQPR